MQRMLVYCACLAAMIASVGCAQTTPPRPNVIFILSDDLGYSDIGAYGQKLIQTPSLDRMAREGLRFTDAYAGSCVCAPSRCTLLTGKHTGHAQIRENPNMAHGWNAYAQGDPPIADDTLTFAKVFKSAGYDTACFGKWGEGAPGKIGSPDRLGFDTFLGYASHDDAQWYYPDHLWQNNRRIPLDGKTYTHDLFTQATLDYVRAHKARPFMIYLAYTIPHVKLTPPTREPYEGKPWPNKEREYAAMVTRMDRDIGKLFSLLADLKIDRNTLVIFASDNGPCSVGGHVAASFDSTPFRAEKTFPYEGGIRVPFIARWPGHIKAGTSTNQPICFYDFLPTACELTGQPTPPTIDGISFLPTLLGHPDQQKPHEYFYWELARRDGFQEIRVGDWKGERRHLHDGETPTLELYDLRTDPKEAHDAAAEHPDIVANMERIAQEAHTPDPRWPLTDDEMKTAPPKLAHPPTTKRTATEGQEGQ